MADDSTMTTTPGPAVSGGSLTDRLAGKVKEVAGSVVGDDALAVEGRLQTAKADAADDAVELAQTAQARDAKAELAAREQRLQAEQAELAAHAREDAQVQAVEAKAAKKAAQVERDAARRKESAERTRKLRESAADRDLFAAASERAEAEQQADKLSAQARQEAGRPLTPPVVAATGVRALPGRALVGYLNLVHRPISLLASAIGKDESWAPMLALASLRAGIERSAGSVLHDAALSNAGERAGDELRRRQLTAELDARALSTRAEANRALAIAKQQSAVSKKATTQVSEAQEATIESDAAAAKRATATAKASEKARVADAAAASAKARDVADRDRSTLALRKEAEALQAERSAMGKQDEVTELDRAVKQSKAERNRR